MAALDYSKLTPVPRWTAGPLRVCDYPAESDALRPAKRYAPYGSGYAIPVEASWPMADGVELELELIDGALRLVGLEVVELRPDAVDEMRQRSGLPARTATRWLTGTYLRELPIDRAVARAAQMLAVRLYRRPRGEVIGVNAYEAAVDQFAADDDLEAFNAAGAYLEQQPSTAAPRRGRKPIAVETLRRAAELARQADLDGVSRIEAICTGMDPPVRPATARKYLARAREAHLLPPSTRGGTNAS